MKNIYLSVTVFVVLVFAACSKKISPAKTVSEPPKIIMTTYAVDILPLIQMKCSPCHLPSKGGNKPNFENYISAQKSGAEMVSRIERNPGERGFMPFRQPTKLTVEEIAVFKKWLSDGLLEK